MTLSAQVIKNDSVRYFLGRIIDSEDHKPVQFAHIINRNSGLGMISDTLGYFTIRVQTNDFLTVTAIGFYDLAIQINDTLLLTDKIHDFHMSPRTYPIKTVDINPLGTYDQFKYNVLNLEITEPRGNIHPSIMEDINRGTDTLDMIEPLTITSPISVLYYLFSKEGKSIRRLQETLEKEKLEKKMLPKIELAERITGLKGVELQEFLDFCNFEIDFFLSVTEYEAGVIILKCYEEYKKK